MQKFNHCCDEKYPDNKHAQNRRKSCTGVFLYNFLARLAEEKKSSYCRHSGVSVCVSVWIS